MDQTILKRIRATPSTCQPYAEAEGFFMVELGREPDDLWELVAFLETQADGDRRLTEAVRTMAIKYQPKRRNK